MAGPQGRLLLCLLVFYLAGSSILMGQKVSMSQLQGDMVSRLCWLVVGAGGRVPRLAQVWRHKSQGTSVTFPEQKQRPGCCVHLPGLRSVCGYMEWQGWQPALL